jgi:hypothetical protein
MILKWVLNLIGIVIFFLIKFNNRKDKKKEPSLEFWLIDNWVELLTILLFDIALMLLALQGELKLSFTKLFPTAPEGITLVGDLTICFFVGVVLAWTFYKLVNKYLKSQK